MLNESVKPVNVLTEEELNNIKGHHKLIHQEYLQIERLVTSHRTLNLRNAKLVHENDELMAENEKLNFKKEILKRAVEDIIVSVDFTDAETVRALAFKALEELNHE